jgi:TetR/AcrR family transcriptional regulator, fatty acid metabolism regulator protein
MQKKKLTMRQTQAIKTRTKIYNTAFDMMEKKGFDNITIEEISKKAGVSVGAFYHYFKSKNDILFEIYHRADEYFKDTVENKLVAENALNQIVEYFIHYARYANLTGIEFTKHLYNTDNKFFIRKDRYMLTVLEDIIGSGQAKGEISSEMSPDEMTDYLFVIARGIIFDWCLYNGAYDLEAKMDFFFKRIVSVFGPK